MVKFSVYLYRHVFVMFHILTTALLKRQFAWNVESYFLEKREKSNQFVVHSMVIMLHSVCIFPFSHIYLFLICSRCQIWAVFCYLLRLPLVFHVFFLSPYLSLSLLEKALHHWNRVNETQLIQQVPAILYGSEFRKMPKQFCVRINIQVTLCFRVYLQLQVIPWSRFDAPAWTSFCSFTWSLSKNDTQAHWENHAVIVDLDHFQKKNAARLGLYQFHKKYKSKITQEWGKKKKNEKIGETCVNLLLASLRPGHIQVNDQLTYSTLWTNWCNFSYFS